MIKEIRCFCEVVQQQSLAAAARSLNMSAPMMTRHIQRLEQELNVVLLHRTTRGMHLSEEGELFYQQAQEILATYEAGMRSVNQHALGISGTVKIGVPRFYCRIMAGSSIK